MRTSERIDKTTQLAVKSNPQEKNPVAGEAFSKDVSEPADSKGKPLHTIWKILFVIIILIVINSLLSFVLEPYMGSSEEMWTNYRRMGRLDTIYTGTSQCLQGIDPSAVDKETGSTSYNMATNMQSFADSEEAIRCAIKDYSVKRVVLAIDHEMLGIDRSDDARASQSFWYGKAVTESGIAGGIPARIRDGWTFMTSPDFFGKPASLTYLTPWVYNRTSNLRLNLEEKKEKKVLDPTGHRTVQGFQPSDETIDPTWHAITWDEADEWDTIGSDFQELTITENNRKALARIRDLCRENDVQLITIILPYPNHFSIYRKSDYLAIDNQLEELLAEDASDTSAIDRADSTLNGKDASARGQISFYDFNLILPEYYDGSSNDLYADVGHMNTKGAEHFSAFFGQFLNHLQAREDVSYMFYKISPYKTH